MDGVENISLRQTDDGLIVPVKVVPGASRDRIAGVLGDCLKITTSAPAEKGKANAAVARIRADCLGVSPREVTLVSGPTNPRKEFLVANMTTDRARQRLLSS